MLVRLKVVCLQIYIEAPQLYYIFVLNSFFVFLFFFCFYSLFPVFFVYACGIYQYAVVQQVTVLLDNQDILIM